MEVTLVDGKAYKILHSFGPSRALVEYDGIPVFVDQAFDGTWDLSGEPARQGEEMTVLRSFTDPMNDKTIVTVTPPDDK